MSIADDQEKPKQDRPIARSLESIAALRAVMEMKLAQAHRDKTEYESGPASEPQKSADTAQEKSQTKFDRPESESKKLPDPTEWPKIMFGIAQRSQKLVGDFLARNGSFNPPAGSPDPGHIGAAFMGLTDKILRDPVLFADAQISLWQGYLRLWQSMFARLTGKKPEPVAEPAPGDKRFQDEAWQNNWLFDFIKQSYLLTAGCLHSLVRTETEGLDPKLAHKIDFYTSQMVDAVSPSNFWLTNPEVLRRTFESGGENLVKGLENLLGDLERGKGNLRISMTDNDAFTVGSNLATTPGKVIFQNELMQLIQYRPLSAKAHKTPLLIIPPWINKYYILDLREKNSFIRYLVAQGHTVFCISWVNPDERLAQTGFDDYMASGALTAMREVKRATGEDQINILGYCIGGTLLAMTLAWLKALPDAVPDLPQPASATYLVALTDFSEPGDIGVFVDDEQIRALEDKMAQQGYLDAASLSTTFNLLRSNDLIWSFVINNYLLGKEPFPFDILYWNADSTNLPVRMHSFYLRRMYLENKLTVPGGITVRGMPLDLCTIEVPAFILSTHDDHIAPWRSTYKATQLYKGPVKFVLSGSGHIAGIVNPPAANKYGYWTNDECLADPEQWFKEAEAHAGSWWPEWIHWLAQFSGGEVDARKIQNGLEDAPGSYVKVRSI